MPKFMSSTLEVILAASGSDLVGYRFKPSKLLLMREMKTGNVEELSMQSGHGGVGLNRPSE